MLKAKLLAGGGAEATYVDDVFSAYTYTGNGSTQTITNGIDLSGQGGMVWFKSRSAAMDHWLVDTDRTGSKGLYSNATSAQATATNSISAFNSNGFSITNASGYENSSGGASSYISWTFRKAPKFFDVVTWTGNNTPRTIAHSLGSAPGIIMVKKTNTADSWYVYHRSLGNGGVLYLEQIAAAGTGSSYWNSTDPTASVFSVGGNTGVNGTGNTYVAYLFAHDTGTDGLIQCGSFTTDGSGNATVSLGWEPQYLMVKASSTTFNWQVVDSSREFTVGNDNVLSPNTTAAEGTTVVANPTATGFYATTTASQTLIYLAIRRPNKPPTVGTQVYNAIARTGTGAAATVTGVGFAPDLAMFSRKASAQGTTVDRLRGNLARILTTTTAAETTSFSDVVTGFGMDGISVGADASISAVNGNTLTYINHFFKRAPGVFDVVCYTGTGANKTEAHGLGVAAEFWIVKSRNAAIAWYAGSTQLAATDYLSLNNTWASGVSAASWNSTYPTSSVFSLGNDAGVNQNTTTYVAYLFATKSGISKVGSYTGTGTTLAIDCGFTTGARFILIKRTDSTGDWYVWDTVRGIIAGNDPYLLLNSTAAEVTSTDYIDSYTSGFELSSTAPAAINASGGTYIYLAFA